MQRPTVKIECVDPAHLPPSYHLQQLQQQIQQRRQLMVPPSYTSSVQSDQGIQVQGKRLDTNGTENKIRVDENGETQQDFQSIKGVFGWTVIDNVNIPYILRNDQQFVSVRIVEMKLLSRYPNSYPDDLGKHAPLTSFFITKNEAKLLNEINLEHCAGEYGKTDFSMKDLIVLLSDFIHFYTLVKKTFPDADAARQKTSSSGSARWLQIKNTVIPYVIRPDGKFVPLSVIQYAAGLLTNENVSGVPPTLLECNMLNEACKNAGVEFVFSDTSTRLVKVDDITRISPVDMIELPSNNPLKHATYMELPTTSSTQVVEKTKTVTFVRLPKVPQINQQPAQVQISPPYHCQPNVSLDMIRQQNQSTFNVNKQTGCLPSISFNPSYTDNQMMDPQMYKMQFPMPNRPMISHTTGMNHMFPPCSGSNMNQNMLPHFNQMFQLHYQNLITNQQPKNQVMVGPPYEHPPQPTKLPPTSSIEMHNQQSPRSYSNPSPWTHPTTPQSRPPSSPRLPLGLPMSSAHVMSPPAHVVSPPVSHSVSNAMSALVHSSSEDRTSIGQLPSLMAIQHIQNMCAQRFPEAVIPGKSVAVDSSSNQSYSCTNSSNTLAHNDQVLLSPSKMVNKTVITDLISPSNQIRPGQGSQSSANQEIPGLFTPTGATVTYQNPSMSQILSINSVAPPPLLFMLSPSVAQSDILSESTHTVPAMPPPRPIIQKQLLPRAEIAVKQTSQVSLIPFIQGAWLNNKSISCMCLEQEDRKGRFCLVEAVCKLYFNGCSISEFLFALENVLNAPLLTCSDAEEKAFIQYYSLPVDALKCNKMIKFDDLEKFFPQLTYMFPAKEAMEQRECNSEQESVQEIKETGGPTSVVNCTALTAADIEAAMPTAISSMNPHLGIKKASDLLHWEPSPKHRCYGLNNDCVIILD